MNNSGKNHTPLELGRVDAKQALAGGRFYPTLGTRRKGRHSEQSTGAQEPFMERKPVRRVLYEL
jgi:hypothetical protein